MINFLDNVTVNGTLSASTVYDINGNSVKWTEAFTNLTSNSAAYLSGADGSLVASSSGSWNTAYNVATAYQSISGSWLDTRTTVQNNSGSWINVDPNTVTIDIINTTSSKLFTNTDNNKVVHFDTTAGSLYASFPVSLSTGFNVAVMNTGTNNLVLSSNRSIKSSGTTIAGGGYGGALIYNDGANIFAVGKLI